MFNTTFILMPYRQLLQLIWFVTLFGFINNVVAESKEKKPEQHIVNFTAAEKNWLAAHPVIKVALDPDWAPIEYLDGSGDFKGISIDYLNVISQILDLRFEMDSDLTWQQGVEALQNKTLDMFSSVSQTAERERYLQFTKPYVSFPIKIFADKETSYIGNIENLLSKKVVVVKGYAIEDWLRSDYPELELTLAQTPLEGLRMVADNEADVFIGNIVSATYYMGKYDLDNIRVSGETPYSNDQSMAVRDDWLIFAGILQKALDAIPQQQHDLIYNRWMSIQFEKTIDYQLLWKLVIVALVILLTITYWNRRLSQEINRRKQVEIKLRDYQLGLESRVEERTKELAHLAHHDVLTGLANRVLFADRLTQALYAADRKHTQVAVFFIDLDDFKQVDDSFDHSCGDKILTAVAERFKTVVRKEDSLARMGGDEFTLTLNDFKCESDLSAIANKIIDLFHKPFEILEHKVFLGASIGISIYPQHGKTLEDLVRNADTAHV